MKPVTLYHSDADEPIRVMPDAVEHMAQFGWQEKSAINAPTNKSKPKPNKATLTPEIENDDDNSRA